MVFHIPKSGKQYTKTLQRINSELNFIFTYMYLANYCVCFFVCVIFEIIY